MSARRTSAARLVLWAGLFFPIIYSVGRTVDEVGGVGPLELIRGGGAPAMLLLSLIIEPRATRALRLGAPELSLFAFLAVASASTMWSFDPRVTALKVVPLVFAYLCALRLSSLYAGPVAALNGVVTVSHAILIGSVIQFVLARDSVYSASDLDVARYQSIVPSIAPNLFGLVIAVAVSGILLGVGPDWTYRGAFGPMLIVVYVAMLVAGRSRLVSLLAVALIVAAAFQAARKSSATAALGGLGLGALFVALFAVLQSRGLKASVAEFALRGQDEMAISTLTGRTVIWEYAVLAWRQRPVLGYGYYAGNRLALPSMFQIFEGYSNLDNTWLETLVNLGILGVVPLGLFALTSVWRVLRSGFEGDRNCRLLATSIMVGILVLSFVNPGIQVNSSTMVFFAVVAFSAREARETAGRTVSVGV